ncbi:MAG: hypothetical protein HQL90_06990 [Magnetococcales bacterium]|nr:hypothetical protein [Magnetococcales bacterium]
MRAKWAVFICLGTLAIAAPGMAGERGPSPDWTPYPVLRKEVKGRTELRLVAIPQGFETLTDFPPTVGHDPTALARVVPVNPEGTTLRADGVGNYHWIMAQSSGPQQEYTWTTAHYFAMAGPSPAAMLVSPKSRLEIIPQPLPREFSRYRAGETGHFLVRFGQHPLPNQVVTLYAPGQPEERLATDAQGILRVQLPPFPLSPSQQTGPQPRHRPPLQPFQLAVTWPAESKRFTTVFQYEYGPDPFYNRNPAWGWLVTGVGMVGGASLWRSRKGERA